MSAAGTLHLIVKEALEHGHAPAQERWASDDVPKAIAAAKEAFRRDLPELLNGAHRGQWVAYFGNQRVGFSKSKTPLYRQCVEKGLSRGAFLVQRIVPEADTFELSLIAEDPS